MAIAPCLDMDHPVRMQPREMKRWRKQVAPAQAPEDRPLGSGENAGEEDRRARIVGKLAAPGDFMERARRNATAGQARVDRFEAKGNGVA